MEVSSQLHPLAALHPAHIGYEAALSLQPVWTVCLCRESNPGRQPITCHYTDWATPAHVVVWDGLMRFPVFKLNPSKQHTLWLVLYKTNRPKIFNMTAKCISCGLINDYFGKPTGYGIDYRGVGVRVPVGSRIFTSSQRLDRLWNPSSLLSKGYWG
jgi:hypothetical protein